MYFMYVLASLPFAYVFSFISKTSIIAFTNFFILNVIVSVVDAVVASFPVFTQNNAASSGPSQTYIVVDGIRWIFGIILPTSNLKHALYNIEIHDNAQCLATSNAILGTNFSANEPWMSTNKPGLGAPFILFCVQIIFWWVILIIIENRLSIRQAWQRCRGRGEENSVLNDQWDDSV